MFRCFKRAFCCHRVLKEKEKDVKDVYLLKLEDDKYYVGESKDKKRRIWVHENGNGSAWTKKYEVLESLEPIKTNHTFSELIQTLLMMKEHGIDNVRGSLFTNPYGLSKYEKIMAAQLYCDLHNLCRKCGGKGHFITQCKNDTVEDWVQQFGGRLQFEEVDGKRICLDCGTDVTSLPKNYRYCRKCFYEKNKY